MVSEKPEVIAQIMGKMNGGGVESVIMNYYRHIDRSKFQFDFICDEDSTNIPYKEINELGGKVILCPPYQKLPQYVHFLKKLFKQKNYKIAHSNINALSVLPLYAAKRAKIHTRIAHSHSTSSKAEWKKDVLKSILKHLTRLYATNYFACSKHAGKWLFGNKNIKKQNVVVINNGIEIEKFKYNEKARNRTRKKLGITADDIIIGHVGRFMKQKNHDFLIDIFEKLHKDNKNYKLLLIGDGPLMQKIVKKSSILSIKSSVFFIRHTENIHSYYQAMDIFLFPSLYEGLGLALVEAECSGLPCVASTEVPSIASISNKVQFIPLNKPVEFWISAIKSIKLREKRLIDFKNARKNGFDIETEASKLEDQYIKLLNPHNHNIHKKARA